MEEPAILTGLHGKEETGINTPLALICIPSLCILLLTLAHHFFLFKQSHNFACFSNN